MYFILHIQKLLIFKLKNPLKILKKINFREKNTEEILLRQI
jgi:hypothetical protein